MNILYKLGKQTKYYIGDINSLEYKASSPFQGRATQFTDEEIKEYRALINKDNWNIQKL